MSETFDVVVAGGGHNALVAAAYLTRAGYECCVPDALPNLGELPQGHRWLRRVAESAWEVIAREFEDPHTRAFVLWLAFMTLQPPENAGTGWLAYSLPYGRQQHSWTLPKGGSGELPAALSRVIQEGGGTLLPGRRVTEFVLENGRCTGVQTENGER